MFTNILLKMLKQDLILQIMKQIPLPSGNNKVIRLMKDELGEKIMTEIIDLTPKKNISVQQMMVMKIKIIKKHKSVSQKENLNLKIIKIVQKQINIKMK